MDLPPPVSPEQLARLQTIADVTNARARNRYHLEYGIGALADQVHRDDLYTDVIAASGAYCLDRFIDHVEREASRRASDTLGPGAAVVFLIPEWFTNALTRNLPDHRYLTIPRGARGPLPGAWHLLAVATANPRWPRPLCLDWDWCAVFPCVTPDGLEPVATVEARPCAGTCDEGSEAAA